MKKPRTTWIPFVSAYGATKVDTTAADRLPTPSTPMTAARLRAEPGAGFAADVDDVDTVGERRRQYHAPANAKTAESRNTGRAPKLAAIGSATAGPSALIASPAAPYRPMAWPRRDGGATSATNASPTANVSDQAMPCAPRSTAASAPALPISVKASADTPRMT